jgi:hypothetical protein
VQERRILCCPKVPGLPPKIDIGTEEPDRDYALKQFPETRPREQYGSEHNGCRDNHQKCGEDPTSTSFIKANKRKCPSIELMADETSDEISRNNEKDVDP